MSKAALEPSFIVDANNTDVVAVLVVAILVASVVAGVAVRGAFARFFFELEDPRPIAAFRIALALVLILHVHGLSPYDELLFEPTGLFTPSEAREAFASVGPFSLLFFDVRAIVVIALFFVSAASMLVGCFARGSAIATLVLFDSILTRNAVFWEGSDVVLRVWLVYLACARCGEAWSIDAWRRRSCARSIPAWPRRLMTIQLVLLLFVTGVLKHEGAWIDGDAAYLAMTSDFYARFPIADEIAGLGDVTIAASAWIARSIEVGFPLVLVGVVARWAASRDTAPRGRARMVLRVALVVGCVCTTSLVVTTGAPRLLPIDSTPIAVACWIAAVGLVAWAWRGGGSSWIVDRRVWLIAAALLVLGLWVTMNIGQFHPAMLATLIPFFTSEPREPAPLAYTPRVRAIGSVVIGWHLLALAIAAIPENPSTTTTRELLRAVVRPWLSITRTSQSWGMWADPPRTTMFLRVVVIDATGEVIELHDDLHSDARIHRSAFVYDHWWKIAGRIARGGSQSPYPAAFARWTCRQHRSAHTVELWTTTVPVATAAQRREGAPVVVPPAVLRSTTPCHADPE